MGPKDFSEHKLEIGFLLLLYHLVFPTNYIVSGQWEFGTKIQVSRLSKPCGFVESKQKVARCWQTADKTAKQQRAWSSRSSDPAGCCTGSTLIKS